ncbi:MAG: hypothetical protein KF690_05555 [Bacteroidetes bacterium]|nr:hypothetical protein [Bacteroidota bacterium]
MTPLYDKVLVYWNVRAGQPGSTRPRQVRQWLEQRCRQVSWIWCGRGYPSAGTELETAIRSGGLQLVVAAGGDGTLHYTAALLAHTGIAMAILPCGTGNGIARHYGIPLKLHRGLKLLEHGRIQAVDLGQLDQTIFMGFMGLGLDAVVASAFETTPGKRNFRKYLRLSIRALRHYRPVPVHIQLPDEGTVHIETQALLFNITITSQFGSGARIAAGATATDGLLDVCVLRKHPLPASLLLAVRLFRGTLTGSRYYKHIRAKTLVLTCDTPCPLQLDGEPYPAWTGTQQVRCFPGSLQLVVPRDHSF